MVFFTPSFFLAPAVVFFGPPRPLDFFFAMMTSVHSRVPASSVYWRR
jgi:hypothetical protein